MLPKPAIAATGILAGFATLILDRARYFQYAAAAIAAGVGYGMGDKDPVLGDWPLDYSLIDCSGWVRTVMCFITHHVTVQDGLPDGSYCEADWFKANKFKPTTYDNCSNRDGILRVAIHRPGGRGGDPTGHIWFCYGDDQAEAESCESYGGHGPGHRPITHQWFLDHVDEVYCLGVMGNPYVG